MAEGDSEAGGVLLGRLVIGSDDVVIDVASEPLPNDRRSRFRFFRARASTQAIINAAWRMSRGTRVYLGEWHTHPEDWPTPSSTDLRNWARIARLARYEQGFLLFVVVGRSAARVWELRREDPEPVELHEIADNSDATKLLP